MEILSEEERLSSITSIIPFKDKDGEIVRYINEPNMPFSTLWPMLNDDDRMDPILINTIMKILLSNDDQLKTKIDELILKTETMYKMIISGSTDSGWEFTECHCGDMEDYTEEDINNLF